MKDKRRKWQLRRAIFPALLLMMLMNGCGGVRGREDVGEERREEIIAVLPDGESADEIQIIERERTRDAVRYQVFCRWDKKDEGTAREKCYQVTCCRRNGKWDCSVKLEIFRNF